MPAWYLHSAALDRANLDSVWSTSNSELTGAPSDSPVR